MTTTHYPPPPPHNTAHHSRSYTTAPRSTPLHTTLHDTTLHLMRPQHTTTLHSIAWHTCNFKIQRQNCFLPSRSIKWKKKAPVNRRTEHPPRPLSPTPPKVFLKPPPEKCVTKAKPPPPLRFAFVCFLIRSHPPSKGLKAGHPHSARAYVKMCACMCVRACVCVCVRTYD